MGKIKESKMSPEFVAWLKELVKVLETQDEEGVPDDFVHQAIKAQAARIRQLEQQVRNLGGNPNEK